MTKRAHRVSAQFVQCLVPSLAGGDVVTDESSLSSIADAEEEEAVAVAPPLCLCLGGKRTTLVRCKVMALFSFPYIRSLSPFWLLSLVRRAGRRTLSLNTARTNWLLTWLLGGRYFSKSF